MLLKFITTNRMRLRISKIIPKYLVFESTPFLLDFNGSHQYAIKTWTFNTKIEKKSANFSRKERMRCRVRKKGKFDIAALGSVDWNLVIRLWVGIRLLELFFECGAH